MSSNSNTHIHTGSESNAFLCKYCGQTWLRWSPGSKRPVIADTENPNQTHDCRMSPWNIAKIGKARAKSIQKIELKKIEDHALLADIRDHIRHWNSRLGNYRLELHVIKSIQKEKRPKRVF